MATHSPDDDRRDWRVRDSVIVVAVVAMVMGSVFLWVHRVGSTNTRIDTAKVSVVNIEKAIAAYEIVLGRLPVTLDELLTPPDGGKSYLDRDSLVDPWGRPFHFDPAGPRNDGMKPDVWTTDPETGKIIGNFR